MVDAAPVVAVEFALVTDAELSNDYGAGLVVVLVDLLTVVDVVKTSAVCGSA